MNTHFQTVKQHAINPLVSLIQTLDDGIEFYRIAQAKTQSERLQQVFIKMADAREFALAYIRPYLDQHDLDFERALTYHGTLANRYANLIDEIIDDETLSLVQYLEEQAIDAMVQTAVQTQNTLVKVVLKDLIKRLQRNVESELLLSEAYTRTTPFSGAAA